MLSTRSAPLQVAAPNAEDAPLHQDLDAVARAFTDACTAVARDPSVGAYWTHVGPVLALGHEALSTAFPLLQAGTESEDGAHGERTVA